MKKLSLVLAFALVACGPKYYLDKEAYQEAFTDCMKAAKDEGLLGRAFSPVDECDVVAQRIATKKVEK